ncbi:hypothetical protein COO60DRAFT_1549348, partial [Scenedesmus sp. NREL 46B-D3]
DDVSHAVSGAAGFVCYHCFALLVGSDAKFYAENGLLTVGAGMWCSTTTTLVVLGLS